ncbi:MAG: DegT/DnrJ/EryC1/StrS aminotransferase family protein, partial [Deltaproteobacteria bacterium]|nr:DegT/DnrJ/EryC1/StrS aminotransferase family protein [Deltaproteobacteria bacterium]
MTAILLNDFKLQWRELNEQILTAVSRVGESGYLILGEEVRNFEECLAEFWGIKYSIGCANGLDAIEIALRSLELKPGDKVLTTPLSAFATTLAILRAGGTPVFCDTDRSG